MSSTELPNAHFNPQGQLPIYLGAAKLGEALLPNNIASKANALLAFDIADAPPDLQEGESTISSLSDAAINWLYNQFSQKIGDINTWITSASGDDISGNYDNASFVLNKSNRNIIAGLTKSGVMKVSKTAQNTIFSFAFSKNFDAYVNFYVQSGGSFVGSVAELEADKVGYFAKQGIHFIRMAKTFSHLTPEQQKIFSQNLTDYKSQQSSDIVMDLVIINVYDIVKGKITNESLNNWLADEIEDNGALLATILLTCVSDGAATTLGKTIGSKVFLKILGQFAMAGLVSKSKDWLNENENLHEQIASSHLVGNAANFMSQAYTQATTSATVKAVSKHLAYIIETGGVNSNE